jgi:hypothetical protein
MWGRARRRPAAILASLQIVAIVLVGVATVARFHVFAAVDEENHFAYVQEVAEHGRLPWLGRDVVSWQVQAIEDEVYPRHSSRDPRRLGYGGLSSEALQPPLYYLVAVPAFSIPSSYRAKVFALRAFDLILLLVGVALLAMLARAVLRAGWLIGFCLALSVLLWPGIIVRAITVSNAALEIPIVLLYLLMLWHATARRRPGLLVACGAIAGLCVLTQLTLVCLVPLLIVPAWAFLRARRDPRVWGTILATLVAPAYSSRRGWRQTRADTGHSPPARWPSASSKPTSALPAASTVSALSSRWRGGCRAPRCHRSGGRNTATPAWRSSCGYSPPRWSRWRWSR